MFDESIQLWYEVDSAEVLAEARMRRRKRGRNFVEKTVILQALRHARAFIFEKFSSSSVFTVHCSLGEEYYIV